MKRTCRKLLAILLSMAMLAALLPAFASAQEKEFIIDNPYESVDWDTWQAYKTQLHCHTTASDGYMTVAEVVQDAYDRDYDILAITDHGTINKGWNVSPDVVPLMRWIKKDRTGNVPVVPLTDEAYESYINGTAEVSEGFTRTGDNGMLDVPQGIELNMATPIADCHLTGYFCDYGQGLAGVFGDYETPSAGVAEAGGISFLAHVGEYVYTDKDSYKYVGQRVDDYYVNKFARIFLDNQGSSLGMGINSATDCHTRCDRILYDQVLQKTIPNGVVPWGITFSDAHNEGATNDAYTMTLMESFDMDTFKEALINGTFFSVSHHSYGKELNGMWEMPDYVEEEMDTDSNDTPMVTRITVDEDNDTISIEGINFDSVTWVSNGNVIKRETEIKDGKATIDLHADDLLDTPELFLRFYITGKYGICYSQPMVLNVKGEEFMQVDVPETQDVSTNLRTLVTVVDWLFFKLSPIIWAFKYFALGYNPFTSKV